MVELQPGKTPALSASMRFGAHESAGREVNPLRVSVLPGQGVFAQLTVGATRGTGQPVRRWRRFALRAAGAVLSAVAVDVRAEEVCVGDCDRNGALVINELIVGVNMALGSAPPSQCPSFDADGSGRVTVNELIAAVNNALNGCPPDTSGVLLQGPADMLALDAVHDLDQEGGAPSSELSSEGTRTLIRTRIELGFTPSATVGQVNALLDSVGGRIVMMIARVPIVAIQIPDPGRVEALDTLVAHLESDPIVRFVHKSFLAEPDVLPNNFSPVPFAADFSRIDHHLAVRASAAWNARNAIRTTRRPTLVVNDFFGGGPPVTLPGGGFDVRSDSPADFVTGVAPCDNCAHGYHVTGIVAASFDGTVHCDSLLPIPGIPGRECATGMFPGTIPLRVIDNTAHYGAAESDTKAILIIKQLAAQGVNSILNTSLHDVCEPPSAACVRVEDAARRALVWIEKVRLAGLEERFLQLTAAGNVDPDFADHNNAVENSGWCAAALAPDLQSNGVAVPNLTNILVIENGIGTDASPYEIGCLDNSSYIGGQLSAIGTQVWSLIDAGMSGGFKTGTSMATPQVAGLASYVWALAPELTPQQVAGVLQATARDDFRYRLRGADARCYDATVHPAPTIDAYDAVLSLDAAAIVDRTNAPVRLAILDVDDDGDFDRDDLFQFVDQYIDPQTGEPQEPSESDFSRWDLNGDGRTGGRATGRFDLDRIDSMQYGASRYDPATPPVEGEPIAHVTQPIEGVPIAFDEHHLTDVEILCYYAYSALFTGAGGMALTEVDRQQRVERLDPIVRCMAVSLEVEFPTAIAPGAETLLVVRAVNALNDLPIVGLSIELDPSGGTVDDFAGVTDEEGFFQTRARPALESPELTIDITAGGQAGNPVVAGRTVHATVSTGPDIESIFLDSGATPGPFALGILPTNGPFSRIDGTLEVVLAALNATLAGVHHVGQLALATGNERPASFELSAPLVDVDTLNLFDRACGSTMDVTLGRATLVRVEGCGSAITVALSDIVGDGNRNGQLEISGTDSSVELSAGGIDGGVVGAQVAPSSQLRIGIHTAGMGGLTIESCAGCAIGIDGIVSGSFLATNSANLSLAPLTLGDVFNLYLRGNTFTAFGGITGGDVVGPVSVSRGHAMIIGNTGLALSAIRIGDIAGDLTIQNNHGFTNDDAVTFAGSRTVGGAVRIAENQGP